MIKYFLPFHKTGWFYLLLVLWGVCFWLMSEGAFNRLEEFNRKQLYQSTSSINENAQVIHLKANLNTLQFENIKTILQQNLKTPVFIIGNPSNNFIHLLQKHLMDYPRSGGVVISTRLASSGAKVEELNKSASIIDSSARWLRNISQNNIHWRTSNNIIYAPLLANKNGSFPLVWYAKEKALLTFVGEMVRQISEDKKVILENHLNLFLNSSNSQWPIGVSSHIYQSNIEVFSQSIPEFISSGESISGW